MLAIESLQKIGSNVTSIQTRKRDLELFQETIYLFNISIHSGKKSFQIRWEHLGLEEATIQALKETNASQSRLKFNTKLEKAMSRLNGMRKSLQSKYMVYVDPYWLVPESKFDELADAVKELKDTAIALQETVLEDYESEKQAYLDIIEKILLTTSLETEAFENIRNLYLGRFPSREEIRANFYVELFGPIAIPSLKEQMKADAELAEYEERNLRANAAKQLELEFHRGLQSKMSEAIQAASDEFYGIISDNLTRLQELGNEELSETKKQMLARAVERCQNLVSFSSDLEDIANQFSRIANNAQRGNFDNMLNAIATLKADLLSDRQLLLADTRGHRSLSEWLQV
jgi:methyl-accepting chemotaxis protein